MPKNARIRPKSIKELLRPLFSFPVALTCIVIAIISIQTWTPEPDTQRVDNMIVSELNECIKSDSDRIVSIYNCRPWKSGKAVIWRR